MYQYVPGAVQTEDVLKQAEKLCADRDLRLTRNRREVLKILLDSERPLGAYDVLERLTEHGFAGQPPVAYRALDFLVSQGLVHKLHETKTFVPCRHPLQSHGAAFLICRACGHVDEVCVEPKRGAFGRAARDAGFTIEHTVLEAEGVCADCVKAGA